MPRPSVDEKTCQRIINAYLSGNYPTKKAAIAEFVIRFNLSESKLQKILSTVPKQAKAIVKAEIDAQRGTAPPTPGDIDYLHNLKEAIATLRQGITVEGIKSSESAAIAMAKLTELVWTREPETIDQLLDYVVAHPAFTVQKFIQAARDRLERHRS